MLHRRMIFINKQRGRSKMWKLTWMSWSKIIMKSSLWSVAILSSPKRWEISPGNSIKLAISALKFKWLLALLYSSISTKWSIFCCWFLKNWKRHTSTMINILKILTSTSSLSKYLIFSDVKSNLERLKSSEYSGKSSKSVKRESHSRLWESKIDST